MHAIVGASQVSENHEILIEMSKMLKRQNVKNATMLGY